MASSQNPNDYQHGRDFVADLDRFLGELPAGWPYGAEIRNKNFLHSGYFAVLKQHGIAHVFISWANMPAVKDQLTLDGSRTNPNLCAARFLLKPGRKYAESVKLFEPYDKIKDPNPDARAAGAAIIKESVGTGGRRKTFIYVNNRLEGNALETIASMLARSD